MRILLGLLLTLLVIPFEARGDVEEYPTQHYGLLVVCGEGVDCSRLHRVIEGVNQIYKRDLNVDFTIRYALRINEHMTGDAYVRLLKWQYLTGKTALNAHVDATIVFVAPFPNDTVEFEQEEVFGIANAIGSFGKPGSLCWSKLMPSDKVSIRIVAHEIGHLLGGTHTHGLGLMADAVQSIQYADGFYGPTIQDMKAYIATILKH